LRSVSTCGPKTGFQSQIDFEIEIANRFSHENRDPIFRSKSITDFSGTVFDRDHDRDCLFKIGNRLRNDVLEKSLLYFSRASTGPIQLKFNENIPFFKSLKKRSEPPRGRPAGGGSTYRNWGYEGFSPH
jgi:hypothetical protein